MKEYSRSGLGKLEKDLSFGEGYNRTDVNVTSWYLEKITSPQNKTIIFSYNNSELGSYSYSINGIDENGNFLYGNTGFVTNSIAEAYPNGPIKRAFINFTENHDRYLNKISFDEGMVNFVMSNEDRKDIIVNRLALGSTDKYGSLQNILVKDNANNTIKDIYFTHSYFNSDKLSLNNYERQKYLRLRLDGLTIFPTTSNSQKYIFNYDDSLPSKLSRSIDSWGFYNGANNENITYYGYFSSSSGELFGGYDDKSFSSIIPAYDYISNNLVVRLNGADRDPDAKYIQAGALKSINYPTGGKTSFTYEPNNYYDSYAKRKNKTKYIVSTLGVKEQAFHISEKTFVNLKYSFKNNDIFSPEYVIYNKIYETYVVLEKPNGQKIKFYPQKDFTNPSYPAPDGTFKKNSTTNISVLLDPGTYTIKAYPPNNYVYFTINLSAEVETLYNPKNIQAAGMRIKSIQNLDNNGNLYEKQYSYVNDSSNSTGVLMSPIFNFYNATNYMEYYMNKGTSNGEITDLETRFLNSLSNPIIYNGYKVLNYLEGSGSSYVPLGSNAGGKSLGYSQVTVSDNIAYPFSNIKAKGKSIFQYKNTKDSPQGIAFPGVKDKPINDDNGQLIYEAHYDQGNKMIQEKQYSYAFGSNFTVQGLRLIKSTSPYCFRDPLHTYYGDVQLPCSWMVNGVYFDRFYEEVLTWRYPKQIIEKTYPSGGGTPIITTKNFTYNNLSHKQITKEETIFPDATIQKTYRYADEEGNQLMKDRNMIGIPLVSETQKTINGTAKTLQKVETYFPKTTAETASTNGLMLPLWTKTYGLDNLTTPNTFLTYDKYDAKGNILQYSEKGLNPTSFIWGYNQTLPIAKIEGIGYDALMAISGVSTVVTNMISKSDADKDQATENDLIVALDAFRTNSNLVKYQISTYTYNQMIGLTSVTPPSGNREVYKYDDNNRLAQVVDVSGNILKENKYNYSNGYAGDINTTGEIVGNTSVGVFSGQTSQETYNYFTKNMPGYYYWYIQPTSGVTLTNLNNSSVVNLTFNSNSQSSYTLYGTGLNTTTGENVTLEKKINVYNISYPSYGSPNLTGLPNIQITTSGVYLNGTTVSGYFVFKPGIFSGTKDFALISSDKTPSIERLVNYHEVATGVDRQWTFTFKTNSYVSASYTGTPLTNDSSVNVTSFQYQK